MLLDIAADRNATATLSTAKPRTNFWRLPALFGYNLQYVLFLTYEMSDDEEITLKKALDVGDLPGNFDPNHVPTTGNDFQRFFGEG